MNAMASVVPLKRKRKSKKEDVIREKKVKGLAHVNHKGKEVPAKAVGDDCKCVRFKCFTAISEEQRDTIMRELYLIPSKNLQDSHISGLIRLDPIKQRRSRKKNTDNSLVGYSDSEDDSVPSYEHAASYHYKVRIKEQTTNIIKEVPVCKKAFISLHGITAGRLRRLQSSLCLFAKSPTDKRGLHNNRPKAIPDVMQYLIQEHIKSFKPRQSHYSIRENPHRYYLPETLSVRKMHSLFVEEYKMQVSYKVYWSIFTSEFNLKFGLPRTDTCTTCDSLIQKLAAADSDDAKRPYQIEKELHLRKAEAFYQLKRKWKAKAKLGEATVICFDYMQNLPLPHVRDNLAFRARQLWYYVFGIHDFATDCASMYVYNESIAKKGQNDVTSLLFHYLTKRMDFTSRKLVLFSDGCPGQNKNYVMVHFLYVLVHCLKLFDQITYIFPIRGHSFLPNDQDFSVISKKKQIETAETPEDWDTIIANCRQKPSPFKVVKVNQEDFYDFKKTTDQFFLKSPRPAVQLKSLRMYRITSQNHFLNIRDTYSGSWRQSIIRSKKRLGNELNLSPLYDKPIPINPAKLADLKLLCGVLKKKENSAFYNSLQTSPNTPKSDVDEEDNSSGCED